MADLAPETNFSMRRTRKANAATSVTGTIVLGVMLLLIVYPVMLLLYGSFFVNQPDGSRAFDPGTIGQVWSDPRIYQAIVNTLKRSFVTEALSIPVAILIAWVLARTDLPGKKLITAFFWIAFFLPPLPVLLGWIFLFDPDKGVANHLAKALFGATEPIFNIYSFSGIIFAHLASRSIAAKVIFLSPAFRNLDSSMEEASYMTGCSTFGTIRRIVLPILMPAILITMAISLIHSLESFEIELILGPSINFYVFSTKMYQLMQTDPPSFGSATVLGLAVLLFVLPLILFQQWLTLNRSFVTITSRFQEKQLRLGGLRWPVFAIIAAVGCVVTIVPVVCLLLSTFMNLFGHFELAQVWTTAHWRIVLTDAVLVRSVINTLILASSAAAIGVCWYAIVAYISSRTRYAGRGLLDLLTWIPAGLPGIILSLGLLWLFLTVPGLSILYGTVAILVVAVLINSVTTGVQLIKSNMVQLGFDLEEASFLCGASWLFTFRKIVMPLMAPVLLSVGLLTFNAAARNVASIAMLVTGSNRPLSMQQVDYMVDGQYEAAAIVGVFIVLMTVGVALPARYLTNRFRTPV